MLAQVLGAELAVLKDTAGALSQQLQHNLAGSSSMGGADGADNSNSIGGGEFSFRAPEQHLSDPAAVGQAAAAVGDGGAGGAAGGVLLVSAAVLQELQASVQQSQRRCSKWKARCKQLAHQLSLLSAQWSAAGVGGAAGGAVGVGEEVGVWRRVEGWGDCCALECDT